MERIKPRSYDDLKAGINKIIDVAKKEFSEGKYWFMLDENGEGVDEDILDVETEKGTVTTRALLVCRDRGVLTKNPVSKNMSMDTDHFNSIDMGVLESEIPDVIKIIREDGHLYQEEDHDEEFDGEGGNLDYWMFFE